MCPPAAWPRDRGEAVKIDERLRLIAKYPPPNRLWQHLAVPSRFNRVDGLNASEGREGNHMDDHHWTVVQRDRGFLGCDFYQPLVTEIADFFRHRLGEHERRSQFAHVQWVLASRVPSIKSVVQLHPVRGKPTPVHANDQHMLTRAAGDRLDFDARDARFYAVRQ